MNDSLESQDPGNGKDSCSKVKTPHNVHKITVMLGNIDFSVQSKKIAGCEEKENYRL